MGNESSNGDPGRGSAAGCTGCEAGGGAQEARRAVQRRDLQNDVIYSPFMIGVQGHSQSIRVLPHQIIYTLSREPGKE